MSEPPTAEQDNRRGPMTFWGAAMFQWVNAKGWVMVIGTITAYAAIAAFPWNIAIQVGISLILGILSCTAWALFGTRAAAGPDLAQGGARLQHRDGAAAACLALPRLHGRMMPHRAMRERGFPSGTNALDNGRNFAGDPAVLPPKA